MRILVTGANGYIGQGVVKSLVDNDIDVVATDYSVEYVDIHAEAVPCDLFRIKDPYNHFGKPDAVLHLAWKDGFNHFSDAHLHNLYSHCNLMNTFIEAGIDRVAIMGTMHEIGFYEGCVREDTPCDPATPYAISKNALRQYTKTLCQKQGSRMQWLRGFYIVGNTTRGNSIFSKITESENIGKKEFPFTSGQNQFDFVDYDDFCYMVAKAVCQEDVLGIINICSGKPEKLADRVERFINENHYSIQLKYGIFPERPYESKALWGDDSKIKDIIKKTV